MPVLLVYGMPHSIGPQLPQLCQCLRDTVAAVPELKITDRSVSVFFPTDLCQEGLGEELICFVQGLCAKPERTQRVKRTLASEIACVLNQWIRSRIKHCKMIEVWVSDFDLHRDACVILPVDSL